MKAIDKEDFLEILERLNSVCEDLGLPAFILTDESEDFRVVGILLSSSEFANEVIDNIEGIDIGAYYYPKGEDILYN